MPNTYTQIYIHFVFAVKNRRSLIQKNWKNELYQYMCKIISNQGHKPYCINGISDHVHLLISMSPVQTPSELVYFIKRSSSLWINKRKLVIGKFSWQEGFGAFSCSKSQIHKIATYIENQEQHHVKKSFLEEYRKFLKLYDIDFNENYIFKSL